MQATRSEAFDILRKWHENASLLRCHFSFRRFAASLRGRIVNVSQIQVQLLSDDRTSELVLQIGPEMDFDYSDPIRVPDEAAPYESTLVVFLRTETVADDQDVITFTEISWEAENRRA